MRDGQVVIRWDQEDVCGDEHWIVQTTKRVDDVVTCGNWIEVSKPEVTVEVGDGYFVAELIAGRPPNSSDEWYGFDGPMSGPGLVAFTVGDVTARIGERVGLLDADGRPIGEGGFVRSASDLLTHVRVPPVSSVPSV